MQNPNLTPKQNNQVSITREAWCIQDLKEAWGDHALNYVIGLISGLSPKDFDYICERADELATIAKAAKNAAK